MNTPHSIQATTESVEDIANNVQIALTQCVEIIELLNSKDPINLYCLMVDMLEKAKHDLNRIILSNGGQS